MGSPKHLWSGDWEQESAAAAARRDSARRATSAEDEPGPPPGSDTPPSRRPARGLAADLRRRTAAIDARRWAVAAAAVLLLAVVVGTAFAVLGHGGSSTSTSSSASLAPRSPTPQRVPGTGQGLPGAGLPYSQGAGRAWLGVTLQRSPAGGAMVDGIVAGGPADQGGLRPDDVILAIDDRSVSSPEEVINLVGGLNPGQTVNVRVQRGSATLTTQVTLGSRSNGLSTP